MSQQSSYLAKKYVERGNEILRTKNKNKRMLVIIFQGIDIKRETRRNKWVTSKKNRGKEILRIKSENKEILEGIEVKSEVKEPKRLTSSDKILPAHAQMFPKYKYGKHEGNKAPTSNRDCSIYRLQEEFPKDGLPKRYKKRAWAEASATAIRAGSIAIAAIRIEMKQWFLP